MKNILFIFLIISCANVSAQVQQMLIARNTGEKILASGDTIRVFGFASSLSQQPSIPGPTIFANEGDSVIIDLFNLSQGAPHTIHLHGLDVNQQNDGVGHLSFEVDHMDHGFYRFKAPHPGTYLYHCHVTSPIHVQAGMYGLVIIRPASGSDSTWTNGYAFDKEHSYLFSEIDTVWHNDTILDHEHDTTQMVTPMTIPNYYPQFFLVNGLSDQQLIDTMEINTSIGERNYIRFSNLGFYYNRIILPQGLNALLIDSDGRPLPNATYNDTVIVFPGERYGVLAIAQTEFDDLMQVEYINMNTDEIMGVQSVEVHVQGTFGMNEINNYDIIKLYPNPTTDEFYLECSREIQNGNLEIRTIDGRLIRNENITVSKGYSSSYDIHSLRSGIYLISISSGDFVSTTRLVKL